VLALHRLGARRIAHLLVAARHVLDSGAGGVGIDFVILSGAERATRAGGGT
jgi:hypothetical protein